MSPCCQIERGIWNIAIASTVLLLVYSAANPACALLNTTLVDSNRTELTVEFGYLMESLMNVVSIPVALIAPLLRTYMGYRLLITLSALLHAALYVGMIILDKIAIVVGSTVAALGMGIIFVVIPDYVTAESKHENIERNLSYYMFVYNFNGLAGNLLNYLCLQNSSRITSSDRIRYFTACTVITVIATVLAGLGIRSRRTQPITPLCTNLSEDTPTVNTRLLKDEDEEEGSSPEPGPGTEAGGPLYQLLKKFLQFNISPGVVGLLITNIHYGIIWTLLVIVPMCITNTYDNRHLLPVMGATIGISRIIFTGAWDPASRLIGYRALNYLTTLASLAWIAAIFTVFSNQSSRNKTPGDLPLLAAGEWVVYLIGVLAGASITGVGVLLAVSCGKVSRDKPSMNGFQPDVLFAYTMIAWSVMSAVAFAVTPYVCLYVFLGVTLVGVIANHFTYSCNLLSFVRQLDARPLVDGSGGVVDARRGSEAYMSAES